MFSFFLVAIFIVAADFITKNLAVAVLKYKDIEIIKNILYFNYTENRGAAFGMLQNHRWIFISVTLIVVIAIVFYIVYKKPANKLFLLSLAMITGGGVGNLIDRILLGYVVDFIDFRIISFPVFNVADIFVTVGAALLFVYIIFFEGKQDE